MDGGERTPVTPTPRDAAGAVSPYPMSPISPATLQTRLYCPCCTAEGREGPGGERLPGSPADTGERRRSGPARADCSPGIVATASGPWTRSFLAERCHTEK